MNGDCKPNSSVAFARSQCFNSYFSFLFHRACKLDLYLAFNQTNDLHVNSYLLNNTVPPSPNTMADAPEPAFSADERFPKYLATPSEEEQQSTLIYKQSKSAFPSEKLSTTTPPPPSPQSSSRPLPCIATASPCNAMSPPQYAVDTPTADRSPASPAASYPVYMTSDRQDTLRHLEAPRLVEGVEDGSWRIGLCDCSAEGNGALWCDALGCPCILAGRTHARLKGASTTYWSGYVSELGFPLFPGEPWVYSCGWGTCLLT